MRNVLKVALGAAALSAIASTAFAQASATVTTTGTATIIQPIALTQSAPLTFGTIIKGGANTITIDKSTGARTITGAGTAVGTVAGGRAVYTITGEGGQAYSLTVGTLTMASGGNTLPVTLTPSIATSGNLTGTVGSTATLAFGIGGAIVLSSATATGAYSGTFTVQVAYN
jgi:hypothetical protein